MTVLKVTLMGKGNKEFVDNVDEKSFQTSESLCQRAIRHHDITTSRSNPEAIGCVITKQVIKDGTISWIPYNSLKVTPPYAPMTQDEYNDELEAMLREVPKSFRNFVAIFAYESGHSSGYEEVLGVARQLLNDLVPAIEDYKVAEGLVSK